MKLTLSLIVMLSLGLSAYAQDFSNDLEAIDNIGEITDMDQALHMYRYLRVLEHVIDEAEATQLDKRFIGSLFKKIKEKVSEAFKKVGNFFKDTWNKAKEAVKKVASNLNFDALVQKVIPYIHSGESVAACVTAITGAAVAILGPAASLVGSVAKPLCEAALAKLEESVG